MKYPLLAILLLSGCAGTPRESSPDDLFEEYWQFNLRENPTEATYLGDHRYDDRLGENNAQSRERQRTEYRRLLHAIAQLRVPTISSEILKQRLELNLESMDHKFYQWNLDQMGGPQVWLFELVNYHPWKTDEGRRTFHARLAAMPKYFDEYIANLREGLAEGRVATRGAWERVIQQLKDQLAMPLKDWSLSAAGVEPVERFVRPSLEKLLAFLEKEYKPREAVGLSALPGGEAAYRFCIKDHTTISATAEELHQFGLDEMNSIEKEMRAIAKTDDLAAYRTHLMSDPKNFATSREEYCDRFRDILKRVDAKLPEYFARLPKIGYIVKPIEEYREKDCVAAFYYGPPEDGSRPGTFYANCYRPEIRPRYNMAALAVHEAVPGHHLQISLALELKDLPTFRRHEGFTAFVEGWALYTERLAVEMGIYETDLERFGMLTYQAWRAARLVVDTGMHALGWTREKAIEYFKAHLALSETEIVNEIDRYIIWPGQALAYKVGQREIQSLRAKAEKDLGAKFKIGEFHDALLSNGALPLPLLRKLMEEWIASKK
jgi:prolyl oligopeptidase